MRLMLRHRHAGKAADVHAVQPLAQMQQEARRQRLIPRRHQFPRRLKDGGGGEGSAVPVGEAFTAHQRGRQRQADLFGRQKPVE